MRHEVLYDYHYQNYYCPVCLETKGCGYMTYENYCSNCGSKLAWNCWDKEKQRVKNPFRITKEQQSKNLNTRKQANKHITQLSLFKES